MSKDDSECRIAFSVWVDFMKYVSPNTKKEKTVDDFIRSADYIGFVKFGNYLIELKPVEGEKFIQWLFKMGVKLSDWTKPGTYQLYIQEISKKETPERALERAVLAMNEWAERTGNNWQDFFRKVAPATAMNMITTGRISPWIIYSTVEAQDLLDRMEPGQIDTITKYVDTAWWTKKIKTNQTNAQWINTTMTQALAMPS
jgi:hypothetical protein